MIASVVVMDPEPRVTSNPEEVAGRIATRCSSWTLYTEPNLRRGIAILDNDEEIAWTLSKEQALALASRLTILAAEITEDRTLRRPAGVDDELRERDV